MAIPRRSDNDKLAADTDSYNEKLRQMELKARKGDPEAHYWLGVQYLPATTLQRRAAPGAGRDEKLAVRHLRRAANKGHAQAMLVLGKLYLDLPHNEVCEYDEAKALRMIVEAAECGSGNARHILARHRLEDTPFSQLVGEDGKEGGTPFNFSPAKKALYSDMAEAFISEYRAKKKTGKPPAQSGMFPEDGEAIHPLSNTPYSTARTGWYERDQTPGRPGVYERRLKKKAGPRIVYSYWNGEAWSVRLRHPEDAGALHNGTPHPSKKQRLPWRGLAHDPDARHAA
jgi:hypothetical protein